MRAEEVVSVSFFFFFFFAFSLFVSFFLSFCLRSWSAGCVALGCFYIHPMTQTEQGAWPFLGQSSGKTNAKNTNKPSESDSVARTSELAPKRKEYICNPAGFCLITSILISYWYELLTFQSRGSHGVIYLIWQSHPDSLGVGGALMGNHSVDTARPTRHNNDRSI